MCTVTYVPRRAGGFFLNSNRDEDPSRTAEGLVQIQRSGNRVAFPKDSGAGGTWIAANQQGMVLCLLNGAFVRHTRSLPYRMSRGLMLLDLIETRNIAGEFEHYDLNGIEPFTLVLAGPDTLRELRWDGQLRYSKPLDTGESHIWSSATLYDASVRQQRESWFRQWQRANPDADLEKILTFHRFAGEGDIWNDVVMNREGRVQTISITSIVCGKEELEMHYFDLLSDQKDQIQIELQREVVESDRT